jgi:hypothetical protein
MGILRQLFGPSREEIWRQLCSEIGAQYIEGGFWKGDKVQAHCGQWTVTLDTYTETHSDGKTTSSTTYTLAAQGACWHCGNNLPNGPGP